MKECPRCGSALSHYALAKGEAYGCDSCGWVGVDVEHRSEPVRLETWHDAISRFEAKFTSQGDDDAARKLDRVRGTIDVPDDAPESDPEPETVRVPDGAPVPTDDADERGSEDSEATDEPETDSPETEEADGDDDDPDDDIEHGDEDAQPEAA